ncbi:hypothetical protein K2173_021690 [Erythroxylum novogranatense]|uniref:Uncharacterized protein n=1 Tax=Erythroxylum novogranatense TaxID=1862640 RepID=A0AAV8TJP9_9ROSI|nr:hypothetical protein K2173_021690 [Erythroxylum novogranatense]
MENICEVVEKMVVMCLISLTCIILSLHQATGEEGSIKTYIIFVQKPEEVPSTDIQDLDCWYRSFLPVTVSNSNQDRLLYSYRNVVTGFAARLTAEEAKAIEDKEGFVSARQERELPLHTTYTPKFMGLQQASGFWKKSNYGKGVIIGVLDTGIKPDHPSFNYEGMPPPPEKWKGKCELSGTECNNKLIGARNMIAAGEPPVDRNGHGTHTASTAAGSPVKDASFYGQAKGTASGIAPSAHLAVYKVCNGPCKESAILAAIDAAVEEGVDVLSISLGGHSRGFFDDGIAIAAYGAMQKGVLVSCSAGNFGPHPSSVENEAPWILTVGASTINREIRAKVLLGNKKAFDGQSLFQPENNSPKMLPLVYAGANGNLFSASCAPGSLKTIDVKGKIVLCEGGGGQGGVAKGQEVKNNGGAAMILMNDQRYGYDTKAQAHVLPASEVSYDTGLRIKSYVTSRKSPTASISFENTVYGQVDAPKVAEFSSRGPSLASPGILKPDVVGPGVSILAAWSISVDQSPQPAFNMISGTSMACPHLSGIAALLKSAHPDWSPAAIKSAMMTTASFVNLGGKPISDQKNAAPIASATSFDMGAGHVNASRVNDPGLIYDIQPGDYIPYLCGLKYSDKQVGVVLQRPVKCSNYSSIPEAQLNYPTFSVKLGSHPQTYDRVVTNVGKAKSSYILEVVAPKGVNVEVKPRVMRFTRLNQKATYSVTFSKNGYATGDFAQGSLVWKSNWRTVRSSIAVMF